MHLNSPAILKRFLPKGLLSRKSRFFAELARLRMTIFLILLLFLSSHFIFAAMPVTPAACEEAAEENWVKMLEDLKRLETSFSQKQWALLKYWETVYNPLWHARLEKDDPYSGSRKAEGGMLYMRYEQLAENYLSLAEEAEQTMRQRLQGMQKALKEIPRCCDSAEFRICMEPRRQDIRTRLEDLEKFLKIRKTGEYEFSSRLRAALEEKPSDHEDLAARYRDWFEKWGVESKLKMLAKLRDIREKLEIDWPGEKCCKRCNAAAQSVRNDPVLTRVRPDPQGNKGVAGKIVNNASVLDAFERYDRQTKS